MMRQSTKWCAGIALLSFGLAGADLARAEDTDEAYASGRDAGREVLDHLGHGKKINQRFSAPLTAGGEMETMSGETFTVEAMNPSSSSFLTVLVQPGATGDLNTVHISQDLDFSGSVDYAYNIPITVSGICDNGIISCDAGTWLNCDTFRWAANNDGQVFLEGTSLNNLSGCYCINQSCGSNLVWSNMGLTLKHLGNGVVDAIQQQKASYIVTQASIDGPSITYYGQDASNPTGGDGSVPQTEYYQNPSQLTSAAEAEAATQSSDPDSIYSMVLTSYELKGADYELRPCSISRVIDVTGPECELSGYSYNFTLDMCENIPYPATLVGNGTATTTWTEDYGAYTDTATLRVDYDQVRLETSRTGYDVVPCYRASEWFPLTDMPEGGWGGSWGLMCNDPKIDFDPDALTLTVNLTTQSWTAGTLQLEYVCPDGGELSGKLCYQYDPNYQCYVAEYFNDTCQALANNPDCSLRHENVDGVTTYTSFNPTYLAPLPSSKTFGTGPCGQSFTRNWWQKDRQYLCESNSQFDFSDIGKAVDAVVRSTLDNEPGNTIHYDTLSRDPETGAWQAGDGTIYLPDLPGSEECQQVCKTRSPSEDTQVAPSGTRADYQQSIDSWTFYYRTCHDQDICPTESPSEEIIAPCDCINEFAEAVAIMSVLDTAAKTMICSDGIKKE